MPYSQYGGEYSNSTDKVILKVRTRLYWQYEYDYAERRLCWQYGWGYDDSRNEAELTERRSYAEEVILAVRIILCYLWEGGYADSTDEIMLTVRSRLYWQYGWDNAGSTEEDKLSVRLRLSWHYGGGCSGSTESYADITEEIILTVPMRLCCPYGEVHNHSNEKNMR